MRMTTIRHLGVAVAVLVGVLLVACANSARREQVSGNSNWLTACAVDASCEEDMRCVCGVCTHVCDDADECRTGNQAVDCVDPAGGEVENLCAARSLGGRGGICLATCDSDDACPAGQTCQEGSCVARTPQALPDTATADDRDRDRTVAANTSVHECGGGQRSGDNSRCDERSLQAVIHASRNATIPSDPTTRVWSCEAGALRIDPAGYDEAFAVATTEDALLVAGGASAEGNGHWRIERRLLADLAPSPAFGSAGVVESGATLEWDAAAALATDGDHLYVAGVDGYNTPWSGVVRLEKRDLESGALSPQFGDRGKIHLSFDGRLSPAGSRGAMGRALALDETHAYIAGTGFAVEKRTLARGVPADDFGQGGVGLSEAPPTAFASTAILLDKLLYTAGPDGAGGVHLEARDVDSGELQYAVTQAFDGGSCDAEQCVALAGTTDSLYLAATAAGRWRVARRTRADGALVYAKELEASGYCDVAGAIAVDGDAMYVAGSFRGSWRIEKRRLSDGELDPSFGAGGVVTPDLKGAAGAITLRGDTLYVAGLEGPRASVQSSVWRLERRSTRDGSLLPCPAAAPAVPRAPACRGKPTVSAATPLAAAACDVRIATSSACAATNVRASTEAKSAEDWALPEGGVLQDSTVASAKLSNDPSSYLLLRGFGFSIPEGSRVLGIALDAIRASVHPTTIEDHAVRLVKGSQILDENRAQTEPWKPAMTRASYGSSSDLWRADWTPEDINDPSFGIALRVRRHHSKEGNPDPSPHAEAQYDAVRAHVYYCE